MGSSTKWWRCSRKPKPRTRKSPARRSATSSRSTACASRWRMAPGAWCGPHQTNPSWSWWWKARSRSSACATCSSRWTRCGANSRKSANTTSRSDRALYVLVDVDFDGAAKHRAPSLQIRLHPRVAGDLLAVYLEAFGRLVFNLLHEFCRVVDVLQHAYVRLTEHLVKWRHRLDHG